MVYKYNSSRTPLDSAAVVFTSGHGTTINPKLFNVIYSRVRRIQEDVNLNGSKNEGPIYYFGEIIKFIREKVLYSTSVGPNTFARMSTGSMNKFSLISLYISLGFQKYQDKSNKENINSKDLKAKFKYMRKKLRSETQKNLIDVYYNKIIEINNNLEKINSTYKTSLRKIKVGEIKENDEVLDEKVDYAYYDYSKKKVDLKLDETLKYNNNHIKSYFNDEVELDIERIEFLIKEYSNVIKKDKSKFSLKKLKNIFGKKSVPKEMERLQLSEEDMRKANKRKLIMPIINRNMDLLKLLEKIKINNSIYFIYEDYLNSYIWYHHVINDKTLDTYLSLNPKEDERTDFDVNYGLNQIFNYYDKKNQRNPNEYIPNGKETGKIDQDYEFRNQQFCKMSKINLKVRNRNKSSREIAFKEKLANVLIKEICEDKLTTVSSILMLYWCLNYEHLTLFVSSCRGNSQSNIAYKLNSSTTVKPLINMKERMQNVSAIERNNIDRLNKFKQNELDRLRVKSKSRSKVESKSKSKLSVKSKSKSKLSVKSKPKSKLSVKSKLSLKSKPKSKLRVKSKSKSKLSVKSKSKSNYEKKKSNCPKGSRRNKITGKCETQTRKQCPPNKVLNTVTNRCINEKPIVKGINCPKGSRRNKITGKCETQTRKQCPPNKVLNTVTNRCINEKPIVKRINCPKGSRRNKITGKCETQTRKQCPPNKVLNIVTNRCINN